MLTKKFSCLFVLGGIILIFASPAHAYAPIGAGLTAIGSFLAVLASILLAIIGFVWYPLKRLIGFLAKVLRRDSSS